MTRLNTTPQRKVRMRHALEHTHYWVISGPSTVQGEERGVMIMLSLDLPHNQHYPFKD